MITDVKKSFDEIKKIHQAMQQLQKNCPHKKLEKNMAIVAEFIQTIQHHFYEADPTSLSKKSISH